MNGSEPDNREMLQTTRVQRDHPGYFLLIGFAEFSRVAHSCCPNVDLVDETVQGLYSREAPDDSRGAHEVTMSTMLKLVWSRRQREMCLDITRVSKLVDGIDESATVVVDYGKISLVVELKAPMSVSWRCAQCVAVCKTREVDVLESYEQGVDTSRALSLEIEVCERNVSRERLTSQRQMLWVTWRVPQSQYIDRVVDIPECVENGDYDFTGQRKRVREATGQRASSKPTGSDDEALN